MKKFETLLKLADKFEGKLNKFSQNNPQQIEAELKDFIEQLKYLLKKKLINKQDPNNKYYSYLAYDILPNLIENIKQSTNDYSKIKIIIDKIYKFIHDNSLIDLYNLNYPSFK